MAYKRPNPVTCRFPLAELAALREIARAHGLTPNIFVKRMVLERIVMSDPRQTGESRLAGYLPRSVVAPANRAPVESPANRSGFAERSK